MDKITKAMVGTQFERFLENLGLRKANSWNDVGGYSLDYQSSYGGYVINVVHNEHGGIDCPFGHGRRSTKEMFDVLQFWNNCEIVRKQL